MVVELRALGGTAARDETQRQPQLVGDPLVGVGIGRAGAALDASKVGPVNLGQLAESLQGEPEALTPRPDGLADSLRGVVEHIGVIRQRPLAYKSTR